MQVEAGQFSGKGRRAQSEGETQKALTDVAPVAVDLLESLTKTLLSASKTTPGQLPMNLEQKSL
jgi:hypothetical protein